MSRSVEGLQEDGQDCETIAVSKTGFTVVMVRGC